MTADKPNSSKPAKPKTTKPKRVPWCSEHRRALAICEKYGSTHIVPR